MADKVIGGGFVLEDLDCQAIVTPDELTAEQRMIAERRQISWKAKCFRSMRKSRS